MSNNLTEWGGIATYISAGGLLTLLHELLEIVQVAAHASASLVSTSGLSALVGRQSKLFRSVGVNFGINSRVVIISTGAIARVTPPFACFHCSDSVLGYLDFIAQIVVCLHLITLDGAVCIGTSIILCHNSSSSCF